MKIYFVFSFKQYTYSTVHSPLLDGGTWGIQQWYWNVMAAEATKYFMRATKDRLGRLRPLVFDTVPADAFHEDTHLAVLDVSDGSIGALVTGSDGTKALCNQILIVLPSFLALALLRFFFREEIISFCELVGFSLLAISTRLGVRVGSTDWA